MSPAHGLGGAKATILSFLYSVPPSARKKFLPSNQAGEKERGWGKEFSPACSAPQAQWPKTTIINLTRRYYENKIFSLRSQIYGR